MCTLPEWQRLGKYPSSSRPTVRPVGQQPALARLRAALRRGDPPLRELAASLLPQPGRLPAARRDLRQRPGERLAGADLPHALPPPLHPAYRHRARAAADLLRPGRHPVMHPGGRALTGAARSVCPLRLPSRPAGGPQWGGERKPGSCGVPAVRQRGCRALDSGAGRDGQSPPAGAAADVSGSAPAGMGGRAAAWPGAGLGDGAPAGARAAARSAAAPRLAPHSRLRRRQLVAWG